MKPENKQKLFDLLKNQVKEILQSSVYQEDKLTQICHLLHQKISYYDWVGFYFNAPDKPELQLKTYAGEPTEHTTIPFGKGICGQVAISNNTFVVPDVMAQNNYIACSIAVKSEIVVPVFVYGKNIGQIDIDSHTANAFSDEDAFFLKWMNRQIAKLLLEK